jgi:DNA (cytosine-5)-methyltransferase 1
LFSGVMGFDEGFVLAGFTPIWACEIDKKCQSVIRRHLPNVTIYDDINDLNPGTVQRPDVLIASPPCQDFSVAGKRQSLEGIRGYLSIKCVEFINRLEPDIVVIENVPGWLSAGGNAFGRFLGLLVGADTALVPAPGQKWTSSGMVTGCKRTACWTTLDSQFFNVAQRRERVFIVASPRKECASEILFERKSRGRDFKTLREAWKTASETVGSSSAGGSGSGIRSLNAGRDGYNDGSDQTYIAEKAFWGNNTSGPIQVATACNAHGGTGRHDFESETFLVTGPIMSDGKRMPGTQPDDAESLVIARSGVEHNYQFLRGGFGVRRLTPTEAERLQGMPDGWTSHGMDEKGNMVPQSDSARYKQLGNAVTATVSFWIATRVKKFLLKS